MAESGQAETVATTASFGESQYGERLNYEKPQYQDLWAMILFYVHIVLLIVLGAISSGGGTSDITPSPTYAGVTYGSTNEESEVEFTFDFTGLIAGLAVALAVAGIFAVIWLKLLQLYAETIIKTLMFVQIALWALFGIFVYIRTESAPLAIFIFIIVAILCLYTYCVWGRIPFAGACLAIASMVSTTYTGTIGFAFLSVLKIIIWYAIWVFAAVNILVQGDTNGLVVFLLLISYYWGCQVCRNVSHTTTCGVTATWYFNKGMLMNPSRAAWIRCVTTSFGSICFGSLLVASLQATRAILKSVGGPCGCCIRCFLYCIERLMRFFNKYVFAQVAIYGTAFFPSARATVDLFMGRGIYALVNDDLSGLALFAGACIGGIVSAVAGFFTTFAIYSSEYTDTTAIWLAGLIAFLALMLAYFIITIVLLVVASGVVAVFVCFAEDPAALNENRPEAYNKLTGANETLMQVATTGSAAAVDGAAATQPAQNA